MADLVFPGQDAGTPIGWVPMNKDMVIYKGDYVDVPLVLTEADGTPVDLTNKTVAAVLRVNYQDSVAIPFTCTKTGQPGAVKMYMNSATTAALVSETYIYDLQVTDASNQTRTYLTGDVTVYQQVTT